MTIELTDKEAKLIIGALKHAENDLALKRVNKIRANHHMADSDTHIYESLETVCHSLEVVKKIKQNIVEAQV